jgi:MFS family permease
VAVPALGRLGDRIGRSRVLTLAAGGIVAGQAVSVAIAEVAGASSCHWRSCWSVWPGWIAYAAASACSAASDLWLGFDERS